MGNVPVQFRTRKPRKILKHAKRKEILENKFQDADEKPIDTQHLLISTLLPYAVKAFIEECEREVTALCGRRYERFENSRWGTQDGSIVLANQRIAIEKPRVRKKSGDEVPLQTYQDFQDPRPFDQAVFTEGLKRVSQRDYKKGFAKILDTQDSYSAFVGTPGSPQATAIKDFQELSGLRDQLQSLTLGHLKNILSPNSEAKINLSTAESGVVIYFRLQSLMSPQIVGIVGKLLINHLNFLAGTAHRERGQSKPRKLVPVYLDEFATFACPEFADLISKARSAGFALHFSHQSISDVMEVSNGFLNRITDNAATKIVLRINDPDSAEFLSRCFGTRDIQKTTQRITNAKNIDSAEVVGEGTTRDAHQFRASPDLLKTLPTGVGAVLIAHGQETPHGASSVFKIRFPELRRGGISTFTQ